MTPAEIEALRDMCKAAEKVGGWPVEVAPHILRALLSALEEARARVADCLQFIDAALADRDAYESRADALQAEVERYRTAADTLQRERDSNNAHHRERLDALQAELTRSVVFRDSWRNGCERWEAEARAATARADALQVDLNATRDAWEGRHREWLHAAQDWRTKLDAALAQVERLTAQGVFADAAIKEATARADAAWREAMGAAASEARIYANCEAPCSCGSKHRMTRLASTIAALPPPSATPNEET